MKGRNNRTAGHNWEKEVARLLRARGLYPHVVTTRAESRSLDDAGIDFVNHAEHQHGIMNDSIQAKSTCTSLSYPRVLDRIRDSGRPHPVIFHKQTGRSENSKSQGKLFITRDKFAISYLESYLEGMAARMAVTELKQLGDERVNAVLARLGL